MSPIFAHKPYSKALIMCGTSLLSESNALLLLNLKKNIKKDKHFYNITDQTYSKF